MARKRNSSRSSPAANQRLILVGLAILIIAVLAYGVEPVLDILGSVLGVDLTAPGGVEPEPGAGAPLPQDGAAGGSSAYYSVYFTSPVIPFDAVTTGGIETNLIALINNAQSSIDLAVFEFNLQAVADALIAAHNRGVQVRIAYDNEHTAEDPQMAQMIDAGIPATPDERSAFMHNKFFVIDRQIVWFGSWNVTINDSYRNNNNAVVIRSAQLAENYAAEFEEMFNGQFGPTSPASTPNPTFTLNGISIESYFSPEDGPMLHLVDMVNRAQTSVHFMAFSYTDDSLTGAMLDRASAGVQVSGIFEQRGANTDASACIPLLQSGLDIRLDGNPRTFHHKVIIVDSSVVATGSFNFSANAAESNDENLVIIHDPNLAAEYEAEFNRRMGDSVMPVGGVCSSE